MFDNASLAEPLDRLIAFEGYLAILNVELLQTSAVVAHKLNASIGNQVAIAHTQLLQVGAVLGQHFETRIRHVALADVQGPQSRAGVGHRDQGVVADRFAAAHVQVTQFVATFRYHLQAHVTHLAAFGHGQVAQIRAQFGQFV